MVNTNEKDEIKIVALTIQGIDTNISQNNKLNLNDPEKNRFKKLRQRLVNKKTLLIDKRFPGRGHKIKFKINLDTIRLKVCNYMFKDMNNLINKHNFLDYEIVNEQLLDFLTNEFSSKRLAQKWDFYYQGFINYMGDEELLIKGKEYSEYLPKVTKYFKKTINSHLYKNKGKTQLKLLPQDFGKLPKLLQSINPETRKFITNYIFIVICLIYKKRLIYK